MKLIGIKRALILAILLAINLAIAGIYFFMIEPMRSRSMVSLQQVEGQIGGLQSKISNVKKELEDFKRDKPRYEELNAVGFFNTQDRFQMGRDLDKVQTASGLPGFAYSISEIKEIPNKDAASSKSRLISSRIEVTNALALVDEDFFRFIDVMTKQFPAHVRLEAFSVMRNKELSADTLGRLRKGDLATVIDAKASFDWLTIVPADPAELKKADKKRGGR